jgi:hypothetical protein
MVRMAGHILVTINLRVTPQTVADPDLPGVWTALEIAERSAVLPDDLNHTVGVSRCIRTEVRVSHLTAANHRSWRHHG